MSVATTIKNYIASHDEAKSKDLQTLHKLILKLMLNSKLWFLDGKNETGKVVSNPNIGYGSQNMSYADGSSREFYQIGLSANTSGISVYIMGLTDKTYLVKTFGKKLGKASVTGYCIKFKALKDIDAEVLQEAIEYGIAATAENKAEKKKIKK